MARATLAEGFEPEAAAAAGIAAGESPSPGSVRGNRARSAPPTEAPDGGSEAWARAWSAIKLAVGLSLVIGISVAAAWGVRKYAMTSSRFGIEAIDVQGARRLTSEQVASLAGVHAGQNIFSVDIPEAERRLLRDPWVRTAHIARQLPRGLSIELSENEARAMVAIGKALFLVTRTGQPFKRLEGSDPYDIPVVTGISEANLARDRAREIDRIKLGLEVLAHYERLPLSHAFAPQEVHVAADGSVTLSVGRQGVSLRLGKGPWLMKLRMAERVMSKVQGQGKVPGIIFLDNDAHQERVVVRMR